MVAKYGSNFRGGSVVLEDIRLNLEINSGSATSENVREDFGNFPLTLAVKVCDWTVELSDEDVTSIKEVLESSDQNDDRTLRWLVNSVSRLGVTEAISVYSVGDSLIVVKGNRRYTASCIARRVYGSDFPKEIRTITVEKSKLSPSELLLAQFTENKGKLGFNLIEEAKLLDQMLTEFGTSERVSELTGYSLSKLEEILTVLTLTDEAQQAIKSGRFAKNPTIQLIKEAEKTISNPLVVASQVSEAIITATEKAAKNGKRKATLKDASKELEQSQPIREVSDDANIEALRDELLTVPWSSIPAKDILKIAKILKLKV